jgi:Uma2 family endonuclease|tara:strand:+ start:110 stop:295 length:186 start_codon:yes stop_codon:yes gene_type:complete
MDVVDIVSDFKKEIDAQVEQIRLILMTGQCKDHEQYKFFTGQLHQLYNMQDFIRSYRKVEE